MGLIFSAISACCCAANTCSCLASCVNCGRSSTQARTKYFVLWLCCSFIAWLLRDHAYKQLSKVGGMKDCANAQCTGTSVVLRVTLAMVLLSSTIGVLVWGVSSSKDPRSGLQNDFFPLKYIAQGAIIIGCFFIDNSVIMNYGYASAACSSIFMLGGILLMLEWAHSWNDKWVEKMDSGGKGWGHAIVGVSSIMYGCSIAVWVVLLVYFGGPHCTHTNVFVSVTIVISVILTVVSLLNVVTQGALLPSAVMISYATYLVTSAVISIPVDNTSLCVNRHDRVGQRAQRGVYSVGVVLTIFCVLYATARLASKGQDLSPGRAAAPPASASAPADPESSKPNETVDDETEKTEYSYTFFHIIYAAGAMYLGMVLIDWDIALEEKTRVLGNHSSWIPMWVKIASQWTSFLLYAWSLLAPVMLKDRDFS